jgi:formate hydrogenlyase transcriptional activator
MLTVDSQSDAEIYGALFALAKSISGHNDIEGLCRGLAESLQRVVRFEYLGLMLHDPARNVMMRRHVLTTTQPVPVEEFPELPIDEDPAGWVWRTQAPLVISPLAAETRWPKFIERTRKKGLCSLSLVPLSIGERRIGVLGFGGRNVYEPVPAELSFLERVASEFAVAVDSFLMQQTIVRERDRLRVLFDITNALVSKLSREDLFSAISEQLSKVIAHDFAALTLLEKERNELQVHELHFTSDARPPIACTSVPLDGLPAREAIASGKPVVQSEPDLDRFPSPFYKDAVGAGARAICSLPLTTPNGIIGTLELGRLTCTAFTDEDINLGSQVARQIAIALENALAYRELAEMRDKVATEKLYLEDEIRFDQNIGNMVGDSQVFQALLRTVQVVAPTAATVLILGETGTGKELIARAVHEWSDRRNRSFVKLNCAAIPATLLESELFGHEKGAFTGAIAQKIGRFELAHQGTLFLDEVGEIPLELQSKLLRAVQEQEFERLGSNRTIRVDVRIIAATNRDLKVMVDDGKFRSDLYYRLHVFPIQVPPLRERREDIPSLVRHFIQRYASRMNRPIDSIPSAAIEALTRYDWPGNIRELQNVIERSVILTQGKTLTIAMPEVLSRNGMAQRNGLEMMLNAERERILRALKLSKGVVGGPNGAAARLGLKRTTLQFRMRKLNISRAYTST